MIQINYLNIYPMKDEALFEYSTQYINWVHENPEIAEEIEVMLTDLILPAHQKLADGIQNMMSSEHTLAAVNIDKLRENYWLSIGDIVSANSRHPLQEYRDWANQIQRIIDNNKGHQTATIRNIIQVFRGKYKEIIEKLGLTFWVYLLENANNDFSKLSDARFSQTAVKITADIKDIRTELGDAFKITNNFLNGLAIIAASDPKKANIYDTAFKKLNDIIDYYDGNEYTSEKEYIIDNNEDMSGQTRPWTAGIDFNEWELGDYCFTEDINGRQYWEAIDLGQIHKDPLGESGHFGWKLV
jgi:hypothetical protein